MPQRKPPSDSKQPSLKQQKADFTAEGAPPPALQPAATPAPVRRAAMRKRPAASPV